MVKICALLIGLPASGKTTFREQLLSLVASKQEQVTPIWTTVSIDDLVEIHAKSRGETYSEAWPSYIKKAEEIAFAQLKYAADSGDDVIIIDRTHMSKTVRAKMMNMVRERNPDYKFIAFNFHCEPKEWERRVNNRPGKNIPPEAIQRMKASYEVPSLDEGFDFIQNINTTCGFNVGQFYDIFLNIREGKPPHEYRK